MPRTADDDLELRRLTPAMRAYTVGMWLACAALFAGLAHRYPTGGHGIGYAIGLVCAWTALYWLRVPSWCARVRGDGVSYLDERLGALFVFRWHHAAWTDVVAVDTREVVRHTSRYVRTRVTVRAESGGTRTFTVTSRDAGYGLFIDVLAAHTSGMPIRTSGLGVEASGVRSAIHRIRAGRMSALGTFALLAAAMAIVAFITRR